MNKKKYFFEKITEETLNELNAFLSEHPQEQVSYWEWREALELYSKVFYELAESVKGYGEAIDEILKQYNWEDLHKDPQGVFLCDEINAKLAKLEVVPNQSIEDKLKELRKKHY